MTLSVMSDEHFMKEALKEAEKALEEGERPVGAIITCQKTIVARAHQQIEQLEDSTAHAEMIALTAAMQYLGTKELPECSLYVTLEPCPMCTWAARLARLDRLVYGTGDREMGYTTIQEALLPSETDVISEVMQPQCAEIMMDYYSRKRTEKPSTD